MIQVIFTLDYEIYGNGAGTLRELVIEPTRQLAAIFKEYDAPFVVFAEALEFSKMEEYRADEATPDLRLQLRALRAAGHEIALHLHPWWADARREQGSWRLNWEERNLCAAAPDRIEEVVGRAVNWLRDALEDPAYCPVSFRAGLWLMQPTAAMARVLARHGVGVDSSVFKGGRTRAVGLDYRPALRNGWSWRFSEDVNTPDVAGLLLELPICSEMVPFWTMLGLKRLSLQKKVPVARNGEPLSSRWRDFLRFRYPRKLDFCRMTAAEMCAVIDRLLYEDKQMPPGLRPVVAIGHSKDLVDFDAIAHFLDFLRERVIPVTILSRATSRLQETALPI